MTPAVLGTLAALALMDSTSFGTLLIPIWLMLAPGRIRVARIIVFVVTVAAFYLVLGIVLSAGVAAFSDRLSDALDSAPVQVVMLAGGAALVVTAIRVGRAKDAGEPGRLIASRERAVGDEGTVGGLMALAVTAAVIEAASMVPYLAAIGIIGTTDLSWPLTLLVLAGYCLVMILPALLLLAGRIGAARLVEPLLQRVNAWMVRNGRENTAWILGIIGFYVGAVGAEGLGLIDQIDAWSTG